MALREQREKPVADKLRMTEPRTYHFLRQIVEEEGGEMRRESAGYGAGGAWIVILRGKETIFRAADGDLMRMARLYYPKPEISTPRSDRDFTCEPIEGAREIWLGMLGTASNDETHRSTADSKASAPVPALLATVIPPFEGASEYLDRIKSSRGLAERNMEDLVKELLVRLGHAPASVVFQVGYIDVSVHDRDGKPRIVVEVKTSLRSKPDRDAALRQAFDYAGRNGAPLVVITDADAYEIYDRRLGLDHASMLRAKFQLTVFRETDTDGFDILKP